MQIIEDLEDLFSYYIHHLFAAEKQTAEIMPLIIEKAQHQSLKNALQHHLTISKKHSTRLSKIATVLKAVSNDIAGENDPENELPITIVNSGITGLINEINELLLQQIHRHVNDAAIIGWVQKIEHYEICAYGTALAYATQLHLHKAAELLRETLDEEYDANDLLTALATAALNKEGIPENWDTGEAYPSKDTTNTSVPENVHTGASITEKNIQSPGGRAGISHRQYPTGESRGH